MVNHNVQLLNGALCTGGKGRQQTSVSPPAYCLPSSCLAQSTLTFGEDMSLKVPRPPKSKALEIYWHFITLKTQFYLKNGGWKGVEKKEKFLLTFFKIFSSVSLSEEGNIRLLIQKYVYSHFPRVI